MHQPSKLPSAVTIPHETSPLHKAISRLDAFSRIQRGSTKKSKGSSTNSNAPTTWAKGTGYGGPNSSVDNATMTAKIRKAHTAESQADSDIRVVFLEISHLMPVSKTEMISYCLDMTRCPGLRWALRSYLRNDSLIDIGSRKGVYQAIFSFLSMLSRDIINSQFLVVSLTDPDDDDEEEDEDNAEQSCLNLLNTLKVQAEVFLNLQQNSGVAVESEEVIEALSMALHIQQASNDVQRGVEFARSCSLLKGNQSNAQNSSNVASSSSARVDQPAVTQRKLEKTYVKVLGPLRFEPVELVEALQSRKASHCIINTHGGIDAFLSVTTSSQQHSSGGVSSSSSAAVGSGSGLSKQRMLRVAKEVSSLVSSLPIEYGSCIFVRCDESRYDIIKALITGPENTPYQNGCFEFDILLPSNYPASPPSVKLITTGGGTVRFNPNLYNDGKVCLSLLGTWPGPGWNPDVSTLLQVLISIQSLILVPDPYFNEPGWERSMNTPLGVRESNRYNENIRDKTCQFAILQQLQSPSKFFESAIRKHMAMKRSQIRQQLQDWKISKKLADRIRGELLKLPQEDLDLVHDPSGIGNVTSGLFSSTGAVISPVSSYISSTGSNLVKLVDNFGVTTPWSSTIGRPAKSPQVKLTPYLSGTTVDLTSASIGIQPSEVVVLDSDEDEDSRKSKAAVTVKRKGAETAEVISLDSDEEDASSTTKKAKL